jgi:protein-tyrosine phosphatase
VYLVSKAVPGRLWIMPCPKADALNAAVDAWQAQGVYRVVSLLPLDEMAGLGVADEPTLCAAVGIAFTSHPIVDFGLPEPAAFAVLVSHIAQDIRVGRGVAVHCRAGIGRSGMTVAGTLMALGDSVENAIKHVSRARGVSIPDTVEQADFLHDFASRLK